MRLFFDEDMGKGIPDALRSVGVDATHVKREFHYRIVHGEPGVPDEDWIPYAGSRGLFVISCNKGILEAQAQRQLWIENGVGGLFLTSGGYNRFEVLRTLLRRWDWLETVDREQPRPFAFLMGLTGKARLDDRVA